MTRNERKAALNNRITHLIERKGLQIKEIAEGIDVKASHISELRRDRNSGKDEWVTAIDRVFAEHITELTPAQLAGKEDLNDKSLDDVYERIDQQQEIIAQLEKRLRELEEQSK